MSARVALVEQHIQFENEHNLEGVLRTFGDTARYDDEPWGDHYEGLREVRSFYGQLMQALPDLEIVVQRRHVADDAIVVEVMIRGTHLGDWRGLPATARRVHPGCNESFGTFGMFTVDTNFQIQKPTSQFFASQLITQEWAQPGNGVHRVFRAASDVVDPASHVLVTAYAPARWPVVFDGGVQGSTELAQSSYRFQRQLNR